MVTRISDVQVSKSKLNKLIKVTVDFSVYFDNS